MWPLRCVIHLTTKCMELNYPLQVFYPCCKKPEKYFSKSGAILSSPPPTATTATITYILLLLPTKDRSSTPGYSHSVCKREFNVKLAICSIHLCIHHHLDRNTEKDMMDYWMVLRLLHYVLLLVAYQLTTSIPPHNIHSTNANMYSAWSCWSPLFIHAFCISCIQILAEIWTK